MNIFEKVVYAISTMKDSDNKATRAWFYTLIVIAVLIVVGVIARLSIPSILGMINS